MSHDHPTHADKVYDHPIEHHDPREGFDRSEPAVGAILGFTVGSVVLLILVIVALQGYFDQIYYGAVDEKILQAPSEQLQEVRNRDAWNLSHYMYGDLNKDSNRIRIPLDQAMQKFADEAKAGKLFYGAKAAPIKHEENTGVPALPEPAPAAAPSGGAAAEK